MDANIVMQAISTVGFPIVACCAMYVLYNKTITNLTGTLTKIDATLDKLFTIVVALDKKLDKADGD